MSKNSQKNIESSFIEHLVDVNRVTKVVKGGRNFSFAALVVVGDENGRVGVGSGKAKEVSEARAKATKDAKKNIIKVSLHNNHTVHHDIIGTSGAAKVLLRKAPPGTGVIAGGPMRAVFACLGIQDVVAKSMGSSNPYLMISATFDALKKIRSPKFVAKKLSDFSSYTSTN